MKIERQKQIQIDAVLKVQNFLSECENKIKNGELFSADQLARKFNTSGAVAFHAVKLGVLKKGEIKGEFFLGSNFGTDRTTAKKIIESNRISKVKRNKEIALNVLRNESGIKDPESDSKQQYDQESVPKIQSNSEREITSLLKRALNSANPMSNPSLFSGQEKEFDDKLKIACSIAGGCYVSDQVIDIESMNDFIIKSTNDLYEKLKNN